MTGVILAGGSNRRYPILKGLIEFKGKRIIERIAESLKDLPKRIIITNNPEVYFYLGLPMYGDLFDFRCPLTGIYTALINSEEDIIVAAVDMPLINPRLVNFIRVEAKNRLKEYEAVIPIFDSKAQPLLGAYARRLIPYLREWIEKRRCKMTEFLKEIKTYYIPEADIKVFDPEGFSFININTPEDKIRAEEIKDFNV